MGSELDYHELTAERDGLATERDRWRRYSAHLRDRLAAAQDAARKWHHHAYCRDRKITAELLDGAQEIARWRVAAEKAAEELGRAHAERDTLQQQLAESARDPATGGRQKPGTWEADCGSCYLQAERVRVKR